MLPANTLSRQRKDIDEAILNAVEQKVVDAARPAKHFEAGFSLLASCRQLI